MLTLAKSNPVQTVKDSSHKANHSLTLAYIHAGLVNKRLLANVDTYLSINHSISRAQDTYGYNRVTIIDSGTGKKFVECGGGYDMVGSALGQWLEYTYQELLLAIARKAYYIYDGTRFTLTKEWQPIHQYVDMSDFGILYGMTRNIPKDSVQLDGGCGIDSMLHIAKHIGIKLEPVKEYNRKGQCTGVKGWHVSAIKENQA